MRQYRDLGTVQQLPRCDYGVYDSTAWEDGYESSCGQGAVVYMYWGDNKKDGIYVCEEHYEKIIEEEEQSCEDCLFCRNTSSVTYHFCTKRNEPTMDSWWCNQFKWWEPNEGVERIRACYY
jgi:hypothetical protein